MSGDSGFSTNGAKYDSLGQRPRSTPTDPQALKGRHTRCSFPSGLGEVLTIASSKIQFLVDAGIAQRQTPSEYLQELEKLGILKGEKRGREVLFKHPALLKVLTA
jgi:hypothetical protein